MKRHLSSDKKKMLEFMFITMNAQEEVADISGSTVIFLTRVFAVVLPKILDDRTSLSIKLTYYKQDEV